MDQDDRACCCEKQTHVHEFLGSTRIAEEKSDPHNHRFAGISGKAVPIKGGNHIHEIVTKTDFYEDHFHQIAVWSYPAIPVGCNRHVHFVCGTTTEVDGHEHDFIFATLIENPIGEES